ncbi:orotate phosphoribosyltransferase [Philodulcilactobacillus myokoensis]|uniref:Orotate phosphoribosyltransferase n=1 Tax=Philodulcilactobacillus myokoensis TaxID=2929573 RepID=A0A9W6B2C5_9LACO|nr:orotate phosphoribosyltransferase [Philodulcilactobacillus myokoensis]GLB47592.1 orotate phosphoribosyltransferase [Philodulcilactobacillus myokoensis]
MNNKQVAEQLLKIHAVLLSPKKPFQWASGIKSPIYTDNRKTIGYPKVRDTIANTLVKLIKTKYPDVNAIGGVATAGVPHAAIVADKMKLPMIYVRSHPKDHGTGKQIEGHLPENAKVVLIDDLISTGKSVLNATKAVKKAGIDVLGVAAIFSYQLQDSEKNFKAADVKFDTVTNYSTLIQLASDQGFVDKEELALLKKWRQNPWNWN